MKLQINGAALRLVEGEITTLSVDAIVNAANTHLMLGGSVAGAIRAGGGPAIQRECDAISGCPVGQAVITTAGDLPAKYVIHAVGPYGSDPDAPYLLKSATFASLKPAEEQHLASLAFPSVSTGIFGFPIDDCAEIMLSSTIFMMGNSGSLRLVIFCLYNMPSCDVFQAECQRLATDIG